MKIDVQARPFALTPALVEAVEIQLQTVLYRYGDIVNDVSVHLKDVNGERGGIDKSCRIVVRLPKRRTVVGHALCEDMYHAISLAARRAETAVGRKISRARTALPPLLSPEQFGATM